MISSTFISSKRIIIVGAEFDSLVAFASELAEAFVACKNKVLFLNHDEERAVEKVQKFTKPGDTVAFFFNHVGLNWQLDGKILWNELNIQCFDWIVDHPMYYHAALIYPVHDLTILCLDEKHKEFLDRFYGNRVKSIFLPLAGIEAEKTRKPLGERSMDVVFTGAYLVDENLERHFVGMEEEQKKLFEALYRTLLEHRTMTLEDGVRLVCQQQGTQLSEEEWLTKVHQCKDVDGMLRSRMRALVIGMLADHDIKVHLYGEGWEYLSCKSENLIIHDRVPFAESIELMADAKIVLNVMPWFKAGVHDRVYTAMQNQCVCLTDSSSYMQRTLTDGEDVVFFDLEHIEELPDKIRTLLENPDRMERIARSGFEKASKSQTWLARAKFLNKILEGESQKKKISIIVPCYNVERYLRRCLTSICEQTIGMEQLELILVDDASQDGTLAILQEYEQRYPEQILLLPLTENGGQGSARNIALTYVTGEYVMFVDADDWIQRDACEDLYDRMKQTGCDVMEYCLQKVDEQEKPLEISEYSDMLHTLDIDTIAQRKVLCTEVSTYGYACCKMIKSELLLRQQIRFPEKIKYEDTAFSFLLLLYTRKYGIYEKALYFYRQNYEGTMLGQQQNDWRQFDRLQAQIYLLEECESRKLVKDYFDVIEASFIRIYYYETLWNVLQRFEEMPGEQILEMQNVVRTCFPNYKKNFFLNQPRNQYLWTLLDSIDVEMNPEEYRRLRRMVCSGQGDEPARVSIIIPSYNRAHLIGRAIRSILNQTYPYFELLVVDDASTDGTKEVMEAFADPRIRYIRCEQNGGAAAARNVGIANARYEFLAFQDSDDAWIADKLEKQMQEFARYPQVGLVYCRYDYHSIDPGITGICPAWDITAEEASGQIFRRMLQGNLIGTPTVVVRKSCLEQVGCFRTELRCFEDYELFLRVTRSYEVRLVDEVLLNVYATMESVTNQVDAYLAANCYIIGLYKKELLEYGLFDEVTGGLLDKAQDLGYLEVVTKCLEKVLGQ